MRRVYLLLLSATGVVTLVARSFFFLGVPFSFPAASGAGGRGDRWITARTYYYVDSINAIVGDAAANITDIIGSGSRLFVDGLFSSNGTGEEWNRRGSGKGSDDPKSSHAFSYSLYGNEAKYGRGMIETAELVPTTFPGWTVRIYHDASVPTNILTELSALSHVRLINVETDLQPQSLNEWVHTNVNPMSWRFLVASDPNVSVYAVRDSDSRPSLREREAVEEFIRSGKKFHIMRDHPLHNPTKFSPILGGMWGGRHEAVPHMDQLLRDYYGAGSSSTGGTDKGTRAHKYADDQDFLWQNIMPLAANDVMQHDSFYCTESGGIAFPTTRAEVGAPSDYVGRQCHVNETQPKPDPMLNMKEFVQRYEKCVQMRRAIDGQLRGTNRTVSTPFKGEVTGSSTERLDQWLDEIKRTGGFGVDGEPKKPKPKPSKAEEVVSPPAAKAATSASTKKRYDRVLDQICRMQKGFKGEMTFRGGQYNVDCNSRTMEESTTGKKDNPQEKNPPAEQITPPAAAQKGTSAAAHRLTPTGSITRWVVISTNENPFYSFFAPIVCWGWTHLGMRPLLLVTSGVPNIVRETSKWAGAKIVEVPRGGKWKDKTSTLMQVARLAAATVLTNDEDLLTTSDVDMYPLDADYFLFDPSGSTATVHVLGDHSVTLPNEYPLCYLTMTVGTWKKVMELPSTSDADLSMPLDRLFQQNAKWNYDQEYVLRAIQKAGEKVELHPWKETNRMDLRSNAKVALGPNFVDAHMMRPGFTKSNWPDLVGNLLRHSMDEEALAYFEKYRQDFVQGVMKGDDSGKGLKNGMGIPEHLLSFKKTGVPSGARSDQSVASAASSSGGRWNITAIIPTCRRPHSLEEAVNSALKQTYPVYEVIVALDSSKNCTSDLKNIWQSDPRVRIVRVPECQKGLGCTKAARARSFAIESAGKYSTHFAFLDDDDVWLPEKNKVQRSKMLSDGYKISSSDALDVPKKFHRCQGTAYHPHDLEGAKVKYPLRNGAMPLKGVICFLFGMPKDAALPTHITHDLLEKHNVFITSSVILSKDVYLGFDQSKENGMEDYDLWLRVLQKTPGLFILEPLIIYDAKRNTECDLVSTSPLTK